MASAATAIAVVQAPARGAQFEFKCASQFPLDNPTTVRLKQMWNAVGQESGGRLHVEYFPNSQLGTDSGVFSQLRVGALHFSLTNPGVLAAVVPPTDICYLGFAFKDPDEAIRVMEGPLGAYLRDEVSAKGLRALRTPWSNGMIQVAARTRMIRTPDDLHGFKVRTAQSKIDISLFKALGANPTPVSYAETYTALQTGLIDGQVISFVTLETGHFFEVVKYAALTNHEWSSFMLVANGDAWKNLPADLQAIVERNNTKFAKLMARDTTLLNASFAEKLTRQGMKINPVDTAPFRAMLRPFYEEWASAFGPTEWGLLQSGLGRKLT